MYSVLLKQWELIYSRMAALEVASPFAEAIHISHR